MRKQAQVFIIAALVSVQAAFGDLTEVFGVYRHFSKAELQDSFSSSEIKVSKHEGLKMFEDLAVGTYRNLTRELLQSEDPSLTIEVDLWPIEVLAYEGSPDRTAGIEIFLVGYCGDLQVFVMPIFDDSAFSYDGIVKTLSSKYKKIANKEGFGMWNQSSLISLGKPIRTIFAYDLEELPGYSSFVLYIDALNTMKYQVDIWEQDKKRKRGF